MQPSSSSWKHMIHINVPVSSPEQEEMPVYKKMLKMCPTDEFPLQMTYDQLNKQYCSNRYFFCSTKQLSSGFGVFFRYCAQTFVL